MNLSPNEIAAAIYWCGAQFGPSMAPPATEDASGHIVEHVPKPGSPERVRVENWLDVAIAICLAESGGDTHAQNPSSSASGLWQIMVSAHGKEINDGQVYWANNRADGKTPTVFDPLVNTYVAARVYQNAGNAWTPWEAYNSGGYKKYLGHGKDAYSHLTSKKFLKGVRKSFIDNMKTDTAFINLTKDLAHGLNPFDVGGKDWGGFMNGIFDFLRKAGVTVGIFLLGLVVILIGLWAIISKTQTGKSIKSAAKAVIP